MYVYVYILTSRIDKRQSHIEITGAKLWVTQIWPLFGDKYLSSFFSLPYFMIKFTVSFTFQQWIGFIIWNYINIISGTSFTILDRKKCIRCIFAGYIDTQIYMKMCNSQHTTQYWLWRWKILFCGNKHI